MRRSDACFCLSVAASIFFTGAAFAQMPAYDQAGPIPRQLIVAKTIFVSNAGADSGLFPEPFTGDPDRPYTEFYAALKSTGDFTLIGNPLGADLVLELRLFAPYGPTNPNKQNGTADPRPMFRLVVYDGKTRFILWTVTSSIELAYLQKTHDKNFDTALSEVLNQFLKIAGKPPAASH
jgi:hypothetical protein